MSAIGAVDERPLLDASRRWCIRPAPVTRFPLRQSLVAAIGRRNAQQHAEDDRRCGCFSHCYATRVRPTWGWLSHP